MNTDDVRVRRLGGGRIVDRSNGIPTYHQPVTETIHEGIEDFQISGLEDFQDE
jgi:hypothetical protein